MQFRGVVRRQQKWFSHPQSEEKTRQEVNCLFHFSAPQWNSDDVWFWDFILFRELSFQRTTRQSLLCSERLTVQHLLCHFQRLRGSGPEPVQRSAPAVQGSCAGRTNQRCGELFLLLVSLTNWAVLSGKSEAWWTARQQFGTFIHSEASGCASR